MAKFEVVPLEEVTRRGPRIPPERMKRIEEFKAHLGTLKRNQAGRVTLGKGEDPKEVRRDMRIAAKLLGLPVRFRVSDEELFVIPIKKRGRRPRALAAPLMRVAQRSAGKGHGKRRM